MITYTYTTTYNFNAQWLVRDIDEDWAEDYGYEDLDDIIQHSEFDLIRDLIDTYLTQYCNDNTYTDIFNEEQRKQFVELVLQELLKGKVIQLSLDI